MYESSLYLSSAAEGGSLTIGTFGPGDSFGAPQKAPLSSEQGPFETGNPALGRNEADSREGATDLKSKQGASSGEGRAPAGDEEVVLLVLNVPFVDVLWRVMSLGPGYGPREHHKASPHDSDSEYGEPWSRCSAGWSALP